MKRYAHLRGEAVLFLLFLLFIWFINFSARLLLAPILPIIEDEFVVNHAQASSIFIFLAIGYGTALIVSGLFSARIGYKKSIVTSLTQLGLVNILIPLVHNFLLLYFFAFMIGFSVGLYLPAVIPLITEYYAEKNWGKAIAIHDIGASCAIFATPLIALFLLSYFSWRGIFVVYACVFFACAIIFFLVSSEVKIGSHRKAIFRDIVKIRSMWLITVIWVFGAGANLGVYSITPIYLTKELELSIDYANTILAVSRLASIGVAVACGFLVDRFNLKKIMFLMMLITGIFTVLIGIAPVRFTGIMLFFQAFFVTGIFPVGLVVIARIFSNEMRSLATGIVVSMSMVFGAGIIPYLLGLSGDLYSFRLGIIILGIFTMAASSFIFRLKELK